MIPYTDNIERDLGAWPTVCESSYLYHFYVYTHMTDISDLNLFRPSDLWTIFSERRIYKYHIPKNLDPENLKQSSVQNHILLSDDALSVRMKVTSKLLQLFQVDSLDSLNEKLFWDNQCSLSANKTTVLKTILEDFNQTSTIREWFEKPCPQDYPKGLFALEKIIYDVKNLKQRNYFYMPLIRGTFLYGYLAIVFKEIRDIEKKQIIRYLQNSIISKGISFYDRIVKGRYDSSNTLNAWLCEAISELANCYGMVGVKKDDEGFTTFFFPIDKKNDTKKDFYKIDFNFFGRSFSLKFDLGPAGEEFCGIDKEQKDRELKALPFKLNTFRRAIKILKDSSNERQRLCTYALHSAIGSIMSRNGSHNIGSHVLAGLSHNVGTMPDDRVFYRYIQHRMDYIATATTDFPTWSGSSKLVNDLMRLFLSQRHLLDYIASSEGLHAFKFQDPNVSGAARWEQENTIKLHVFRKYNNIVKSVKFIVYGDEKIYMNSGKNVTEQMANDKIDSSPNNMRRFAEDLTVALPGGVVGAHAFFTILENVIRNAAKHGWSKTEHRNSNLDIYVVFMADKGGKDVWVDVYDGVSNVFATYDEYWMAGKTLINWYNEYKEDLQNLTIDELSKVSEFLAGNCRVEKLPSCYKQQYSLLSNCNKNELNDIANWLMGIMPEDGGLGNRLWTSHLTDMALLEWYNQYKDILVEPLSQANQLRVSDFLLGKSSKDNLPLFYSKQYECLLKYSKEELKRIAELLVGEVPDDESLGRRLWMPLHHCQQIRIEKSFIDEMGALRRENWGLAEMKISAGYLNKRSISDIGGISMGAPVITPICTENNHLGYHFSIPRPRDVAFICDTVGINKRVIKNLQALGVYVMSPPKDGQYNKPKSEDDEDWNYSYIVLPKIPEQDNPHLPLRVLTKDANKKNDTVADATGFYDQILKDLRNKDVNVESLAKKLKCNVFKSWITYWYKIRREVNAGIPELRILTEEVGLTRNKGQQLVSNMDVWDFVFKELFRTVVGDLLHKAELREAYVADDVFYYLVLLAIMPKSLNPNGGIFTFVDDEDYLKNKVNDDMNKSEKPERELIFRQLDDWFDKIQLFNDSQLQSMSTGLIEFSEKYHLKRMTDSLLPAKIQNWAIPVQKKVKEAVKSKNFSFDEQSLFVSEDGDDTGLIRLVDELNSAYRESDVILRRYEERIISLPKNFGDENANKNFGDENANNTKKENHVDYSIKEELGLPSFVFEDKEADWGKNTIVFMRHATSSDFKSDRMLYLEPLSGTQSYLYDLEMLGLNDSVIRLLDNCHLVTKMYETGLSRMLIVDERVSKFLRNRPDEIKTFCRMGIWCVDETKFGEEKIALDSLITLDKKKFEDFVKFAVAGNVSVEQNSGFIKTGRKFDILIIHQGLIDKWLSHPEAGGGKVELFINKLKELIPYVVITTGRGTPANIPDSARILPFSVLETTLFKKHPEKMVLVDTIMNILPIGEHK